MRYSIVGFMLFTALEYLIIAPVAASDAEFQRSLNDAKCVPAQVSTLRDEKEIKEYLVTCLGNPPRKVGVFCARSKCAASSADNETGSKNTGR